MNDENTEDTSMPHATVLAYNRPIGMPKNYKRKGLELLWGVVFKVKDYSGAVWPRIPEPSNEGSSNETQVSP